MKKLLVLALLATGLSSNAQVHFGTKEYFTASIAVDPHASISSKALNVMVELEYVHSAIYIKSSLQVHTGLEGGYIDFGGGVGINLTEGYFEETRAYAGVRLGIIRRDIYNYPLAGFEGGLDHDLSDTIFIGIKGTGDYRSDYKYFNADPKIKYSGFVRIGFKF